MSEPSVQYTQSHWTVSSLANEILFGFKLGGYTFNQTFLSSTIEVQGSLTVPLSLLFPDPPA